MADFSKPFLLHTDACGKAVAAVLLQETVLGSRPISYASRTFTTQERKFSIYELEALSVLLGVEKFRHVEQAISVFRRIYPALSCVLARPRMSARLERWALRISAFKFSVEHIRSSQNIVTDSLFRLFEGYPGIEEFCQEETYGYASVLCKCPYCFKEFGNLNRKIFN